MTNRALLTIHIGTAVSVLGTDVALVALGISSVRGADPRTIYPAAHLVATWVLAPLALMGLVTGVALGLRTRWGLLRHWWVVAKLAATVLLTAVVLFVLVPRLGERSDAATTIPDTFTTADRLPLAVIPAAGVTLLAVVLLLAVHKPGGQIPPLRRRVHDERLSSVTSRS